MNKKYEKLKRVVIKEELMALTKDTDKAIILNQFIYWSERVRDFDKFIKEEKERYEVEGKEVTIDPQNGWIYKDMKELKEEIMISISVSTISRKLQELVDNGWIDRRRNPNLNWDKTYQYRVNLNKIIKDLYDIGYILEGYKIDLKELINDTYLQNENSNLQNESEISQALKVLKNAGFIKSEILETLKNSNLQNENTYLQNESSDLQNERAIPEITIETTTEILNQSVSLSKDEKEKKTDRKDRPIDIIPKEEIEDISDDDLEELNTIIDNCSLYAIDESYKEAVEHCITTLYLDSLTKARVKIGDNIIPKKILKDNLLKLDFIIIDHAINKYKLAAKENRIGNPTSYLRSCIYNSIHEHKIDIDNELRNNGLIG